MDSAAFRYYRGRVEGAARLTLGRAKESLRGIRSRKIFVLGTGRSGTHWLGHILAGHPEMHVDFEKAPIFPWVTEVALDPGAKPRLLPRILRQYRAEHALASPRHYVDKTHPTIWIAEELAEAFPEALFVGIRRSPYGTVASMLQHDGVMSWIHDWRRYPLPNAFLGIGEGEAERYESLSLAARCALRWRSHSERLDAVGRRLGERCLALDYESLQDDTERQLARLTGFLGLADPIPLPEIRRASRDRWRQELSAQQIAEIDAILEEPRRATA